MASAFASPAFTGLAFTWAGLPATTLLGAALGVGAVVVGLYILRLRRRRVLVAFLPLWEKSLVERKASALRSRLQRLLSLLLSLLLVGALVVALGDPRPEGQEESSRTTAVLLDVSASMASTNVEGKSRLELAKDLVKEQISGLASGDRLLLIEMGARPRPIAPMSSQRDVLLEALESLQTLDVSADPAAALVLARDALRSQKASSIIVVSDGALDAVEPKSLGVLPPVYFSSVAGNEKRDSENIGITAFSARRYPLSSDRFEVLVEVKNFGEKATSVDLSLFQATATGERGEQLDQNRLTLGPGERRSRAYQNLDGAEEGLIAQVARGDGARDAFPADDVARTLLGRRVPARVLVVGEPNTFLDAALLVDDSLVVKRVSAQGYPPSGDFDVTIFDGVFPRRSAKTGAALYFGSAGDEAQSTDDFPVERAEPLEMFGFDTWKKESTVFRLIDPYDIQVLKGHALAPKGGDIVLGASQGRPIFVAGERPEGRFLALGFSPRKSDFVLRTSFPLFVINAIDELFPRGRTDAVLGLRTGTLWRPRVSVQDGSGKVRGPLGETPEATARVVPIEDARAVLFGEKAGFYEIETSEGKTRFAGSILETREAELPPSSSWSLGDKKLGAAPPAPPRVDHKPWFWLLVLVLSVSFIEWWTFHRRWTV